MEIDKITNLINDKLYSLSEALIKLLPNIVGGSDGDWFLYCKFIRKITSKLLIRFLKTSR
jgi:hypothetical protein